MPGAGPWVCIIGGGRSQLPFIEAARDRGAKTLVFDADAAAPGGVIADRFEAISTHDTAAVLAFLSGFEEGPLAGFFTYSSYEQALATTAAVVARFGLRGLTEETLHRTWSKPQMRAHLSAAGLSTPAWQQATDPGELEAFLVDHPQVIVKPGRGGVGSAGVALVDEATTGAADLLAAACAISSDGAAILEEFIDGDEHSVDGYVAGGEVRILATSRKHTRAGPFVIEGYGLDAAADGRFDDLAARAVAALAIDDSFFSLDVLSTAQGPVVIDAGPLLDAKIDRLLWHAGVDVYGLAIALVLGESHPGLGELRSGGHGLRFLYSDHAGTLAAAAPGDTEAEDGVRVLFEPEQEIGSAVAPPVSVADTIGWVYAAGEDASAAWRTLGGLAVADFVEIAP